MSAEDWTDIDVGYMSEDEVGNIARELRRLWSSSAVIWPNGESKKVATLKVTLDKYKHYHFYLNKQALVYLLLRCKDIPDVTIKPDPLAVCPPEVPGFLRWPIPEDSKPV